MRKARAVSSPDRLQQPDVQGCFLGPADSTVDKRDLAGGFGFGGLYWVLGRQALGGSDSCGPPCLRGRGGSQGQLGCGKLEPAEK